MIIIIALLVAISVFGEVNVEAEKIIDHDLFLEGYFTEEETTLYTAFPLSGDSFSLGLGPNFLIKSLNVKTSLILCFTFSGEGFFNLDSYDALGVFSKKHGPLYFYSKNLLSLDETAYLEDYKAKHMLLYRTVGIGLGPEILNYNNGDLDVFILGIALEYAFQDFRFEIFAGKGNKDSKNANIFTKEDGQSVAKFELAYTFN